MHRKTGRRPGDPRSPRVARRAGALHGDGRIATHLADDGRFLRPRLAAGSGTSTGGCSPGDGRATPLVRFASLLQQAVAILGTEPEPGRCHCADLEVSVADADGQPITARLRFIRGTHGKFLLQGKLPEIGEFSGPRPIPLAVGRRKDVAGRARRIPPRITICSVTSIPRP